MSGPHGLLLIDKPRGPTSHDVVARVRRALRTRAVGHAGTLDPMATGLLVVLVGDATRLVPYATDGDKCYRATIVLGASTDTLDADGTVDARAPLPAALAAELTTDGVTGPLVAAALAAERARQLQVPPAVSAIHVDGERAHERHRRGEVVVLPPRPVAVRSLVAEGAALAADGTALLDVTVEAAKGYYVRALGRDLGAALGVPAHLATLRRLRSGGLDVAEATPLEPPSALPAALIEVAEAVRRMMPLAELTDAGLARATRGQRMSDAEFVAPPPQGTSAWMHAGRVIAVGTRDAEEIRVSRGFPQSTGD